MGHLTDEAAVHQLSRLLLKITPVFEEAMIMMKTPDKKGAAITVMNIANDAQFEFTTYVGRPADDKKEKYWRISEEKAERLIASPKLLSTFQNRDPGKERWGGGIKTEYLTIGVSGFTEHWDEAIALVLAVVSRATTFDQATHIAELSRNPHFKPLFDACPSLQ